MRKELHPEQKRYYELSLGDCWQILAAKLKFPPSLEVFWYGYERSKYGDPAEYASVYDTTNSSEAL